MRLQSGFLRGLLSQSWSLEATSKGIQYELAGRGKGSVPYLDLRSISSASGVISDSLIIASPGFQHTFSGITAEDCRRFSFEVRRCAGRALAAALKEQASVIADAQQIFKQLMMADFYLNQSKIADVRQRLPDVITLIFEHPFFDPDCVPTELRSFSSEFRAFVDPYSDENIKRNEAYVAKKMEEYAELFNDIEAYPLTTEQRKAVVTEEDNILLIAAAGSGKSSTLVSKILYLIREGHYKSDQIIAFAYNKDAQLELASRIDSLFERFSWEGNPVPARTFHGFCMDVIAEVEGVKPTISTFATSSKTQQLRWINDLSRKLQSENPKFAEDLATYFSVFKHPAPETGEFSSLSEYNDYLRGLSKTGGTDPNTGGWRVTLTTLNGVQVASLEELRIANWLVLNGINFEYERRYTHDTADKDYRQYYPDFYYPDVDVWHEHFALDSSGRAPKFFKNYTDGVNWKRSLHEEKGTTLFETRSANFGDGSIFEILDSTLSKFNVPRTPPSREHLEHLLSEVFNPSRDLELLIAFLKHLKTNDLSLRDVEVRAADYHDSMRATAFLKVFGPIFEAYEAELQSSGEIDFEDLIHRAARHIESGQFSTPFKYILVDEFQDASQDRLRLIRALAKQHDHTKIFAVGDDWQSIYRFSGADLKVMTGFPEIFGFTKQMYLTESFRSVQQIADVGSTFIQRNPEQFRKVVRTQKSASKPPIILEPYNSKNPDRSLSELLRRIQTRVERESSFASVFILTRYQSQRPRNLERLKEASPSLHIDWKTIHASKGLEADYVVLHHFNSGFLGFPSEISDDPLLGLVIPQKEEYAFAEERRLLYVALTRAKRAVFGFYDPVSPSVFIRELAGIEGVQVNDDRFEEGKQAGEVCPKCSDGKLWPKMGARGPFLGCSAYPKCRYTIDLPCPQCKVGNIVKKVARESGREFFACDQFPKCKHIYKFAGRQYSKKRMNNSRTKR